VSGQQHCINCLRESQGFYPYPCQKCGWSPDQHVESGLYLSPGTLLHNQYQIARMLGHGGFGITYLAWDNNLETKLAIKEYMPRDFATRNSTNAEISTFAGDAKENFAYGLERFLEEARTLAKFQQHAGIVRVQNFFKANGTGYMVMEYVDGLTLKDYLTNKGKLSWEQTLKLFMPVMDALREVHKHGILHRDISPDNIYLCQDNRIKLLDFGSARYALGGHSRSLSVVVKPGYAPEEQYRTKGRQGAWTDVYSVAASMYRCVTGVVPPDALDRLDEDELARPSQLGVQIPAQAETALMVALAVKAENRTQTIENFQQALWNNRTATSNKVKPTPHRI
jgi:serine/threonine protein kinase